MLAINKARAVCCSLSTVRPPLLLLLLQQQSKLCCEPSNIWERVEILKEKEEAAEGGKSFSLGRCFPPSHRFGHSSAQPLEPIEPITNVANDLLLLSFVRSSSDEH